MDVSEPMANEAPPQNQSVKPAQAGPSQKLVTVPASELAWHAALGLEPDDYNRAYEAAAQPELELLRAGKEMLYRPRCVQIGGAAGFWVIDEIPSALAAMLYAVEKPRAKIGIVLVVGNVAAPAMVALFDIKCARRPWEQAQFVRRNFGECEVRKFLQDRGIPLRFETAISKAKKLLGLDPAILDVIDPMTITSIATGGRVVSAWSDPASRTAMASELAKLKRDHNEKLDAGPVFVALLKAATAAKAPSKAMVAWTPTESGFEMQLASGARAALTADGAGWTMQCTIVGAEDLKTIGAAGLPLHAARSAERSM